MDETPLPEMELLAIRIRTKIILSFTSLLLLISLLGVINYYSRTLLVSSVKDLEVAGYEMDAFSDLMLALERVVMPPNDYLITGDPREKEAFEKGVRDVEAGLRRLRRLHPHPESVDFYLKAERKFRLLKEKGEAILAIRNPVGNPIGALWMKEMDALSRGIVEFELGDAHAQAEEKIQERIIASGSARKKAEILQWTGMILAFLTAIFFVLYLNRAILRPITAFQKGAHIVGNGDLDYKIRIRDGTEINLLVDEFNRMTRKLKEAQSDLEKKVDERTQELQTLNKKLEELSITDGLTGLYNHRYFYQRLTEELARSRRNHRPLGLIISDIDSFKLYNDTHGHLQGDQVLKEVSSCLLEAIRGQDIGARYGGEEFVVLLPETDRSGAVSLAERIRLRILSHSFPHDEKQPGGHLTVSLGVSVFPTDAQSPESLVQAADAALYRAKAGGKNRVEASN